MNAEMRAPFEPRGRATFSGLRRSTTLAVIVSFGLIATLAFANGGYRATSWGWPALTLLWVAGLVVLLATNLRLSVPEMTALLGLMGLFVWMLLSNFWTLSATRTMFEGERTVVYLAGLATLLLVVRRTSYRALLIGSWAATVMACAYSLLTRLFPDQLGAIDPIAGYRLSEPIGYWNGLGVFAAMGALLALGFAARARATAFRALAAASLLFLMPTIHFTFSRGAWIAFGIGLTATIALDPRRLQFLATVLVLLPATVLALVLAYRSSALNRVHPSLHEASASGHRLAVWVIALAAVNVIATIAFAAVEQRAQMPQRLGRVVASTLTVFLLAGLVATFANLGGPVTIARKGWDSFAAPPPHVTGSLNTHLFNLSGSGRLPQWRVAVRQFEQKPWMGSGAGTYELYWQRYRPVAGHVRDTHNLYLETLAELGIIGLALLVLCLAPPLYAAARARERTLVPAALGAYVAYLAHAIVDWDWELPAVTLTALACGAAILVAARREASTRVLSTRIRFGAAALAVPLMLFVVIGLVGNEATSSAKSAASIGDWRRVESKTQFARRWAPWSATPLELHAEAQLAAGQTAAARREFGRAVAKDPHDWSLWFELAQASDGAARRRALAEARRLNPLSPEIAEYVAANPTPKLQP